MNINKQANTGKNLKSTNKIDHSLTGFFTSTTKEFSVKHNMV